MSNTASTTANTERSETVLTPRAYRRRAGLLLALAGILGANDAQAAFLDQYQEEYNAVTAFYDTRTLAQTFRPSVDGQLDHIEVKLQILNHGLEYPLSVAIGETLDGVPCGPVLAEVELFEELTYGWDWYSIDLLDGEVFLSSGEQYAIVLSSNIPYTWDHTVACAISGDPYPRGMFWKWTPELGWQAFGEGDEDMVFRTYMVPEPTSLALLGLGGTFVARRRRRPLARRRS